MPYWQNVSTCSVSSVWKPDMTLGNESALSVMQPLVITISTRSTCDFEDWVMSRLGTLKFSECCFRAAVNDVVLALLRTVFG